MAQQKIFKSRLTAKDLVKFNNNNSVSGSPQWQYYSGCAGSQRVVINHEPMHFDAFFAGGADRRHVTRVSVNQQCNNYSANKARSLTDLRFLASSPDMSKECPDGDLESDRKSTVRKGMLWQQKDKLFSQWKERYFILTPDYLQCFNKGSSRITEMGEFIFKIRLCDVDEIDLLERRGYLVISITLGKSEGKIYLRKTEGIRDWFNSLQECVQNSKKRRSERVQSPNKLLPEPSIVDRWLLARKKIGFHHSEDLHQVTRRKNADTRLTTRSEITLDELDDLYKSEEAEKEAEATSKRLSCNLVTQIKVNSSPPIMRSKPRANKVKRINRLSLMSDIGLPDFGDQDLCIDLEKGIFLRNTKKTESSSSNNDDSGNNSMKTNASVESSNSSHSNPREKNQGTKLQGNDELKLQESYKKGSGMPYIESTPKIAQMQITRV